MKTAVLNLRVAKSDRAEIERTAARLGVSMSITVRRAIQIGLEAIEKDPLALFPVRKGHQT